MYSLKYLEDVKEDIQSIKSYYGEIDLKLANKIVGEMKAHISTLQNEPYIYAKYSKAPEYRRMVINTNYLVFYKVDEEKQLVEIYGIFHSARNVELKMFTERQ